MLDDISVQRTHRCRWIFVKSRCWSRSTSSLWRHRLTLRSRMRTRWHLCRIAELWGDTQKKWIRYDCSDNGCRANEGKGCRAFLWYTKFTDKRRGKILAERISWFSIHRPTLDEFLYTTMLFLPVLVFSSSFFRVFLTENRRIRINGSIIC